MLLRIRRYHGLLLGPGRLGLSPADPLSPTGCSEKFLSAAFAAPIIASPYSTL